MNFNVTTNKFGSGKLCGIDDVEGIIYATCAACMSIWSEFLSWANANKDRMCRNPGIADSLILLTCQVTDLAVLNDLKALDNLLTWEKPVYVGGCLAQRFDIPLPDGVKRLDRVVCDYEDIEDRDLIDYMPPFWASGKNEAGSLFRNHYPIRIGVGCKKKCKYCTINITRNASYELETDKLATEFMTHGKIVLIADSPSKQQILEWIKLAQKHNKPISIRNIEPEIVMSVFKPLLDLSYAGLLSILHSPVQSADPLVLKDMCRNTIATLDFIDFSVNLFKPQTLVATNIIVDYKEFPNRYLDKIYDNFDYVSWNPYWDGRWDRQKAENRWRRYFGA